MTTEAARWAVDSWALALNVVTDSEVETREKKQNDSAPPIPQSPKIQTPSQNRQPQPTQRAPRIQPKPQPPKVYPPISHTPVNIPMPAPRQPAQRSSSNVNVPQNFPQTNSSVSNPAPRRLFGKFFGCLFVFFLLIATGVVLLFGVPYAIDVMRETQRSEPPRFPPQ